MNEKYYLTSNKFGYKFSIFDFFKVLNIIRGGRKNPSLSDCKFPSLTIQSPTVTRVFAPVVRFIIISFFPF